MSVKFFLVAWKSESCRGVLNLGVKIRRNNFNKFSFDYVSAVILKLYENIVGRPKPIPQKAIMHASHISTAVNSLSLSHECFICTLSANDLCQPAMTRKSAFQKYPSESKQLPSSRINIFSASSFPYLLFLCPHRIYLFLSISSFTRRGFRVNEKAIEWREMKGRDWRDIQQGFTTRNLILISIAQRQDRKRNIYISQAQKSEWRQQRWWLRKAHFVLESFY